MAADPAEDKLADLLAACDDALAKGDSKSSFDALRSTNGPEQKRLRKKLACVQMLRQLWQHGNDKPADRAPKSIPPKLGRFEVRKELGRGGFGVVYQAFDPKLGRDVAIKIPRQDLLFTPALRERFQTEARAAAGLDHPNIVSVYETGEIGTTCYIASAFCPGLSLDAWLHKRKEPVPAVLAASLLASLADAVHHAHSRGVLHRDLKPANIILTGQGIDDLRLSADDRTAKLSTLDFDPLAAAGIPVPKITDFGLAKLDPAVAPTPVNGAAPGPVVRPTRTGAIVGTPTYMAPEQAAGDRAAIGPTVDVYALGVVLYETLVGRPPFVAETVLDTLQLVRSADPIPPTKLRAKLPRDLETICLKCLRKNPRERYATAADLADDLRRFLVRKSILARPVGAGERVVRWCQRNPSVTGLTAALVLVGFAGVVGVLWQFQRAREEAAHAVRERDEARKARVAAELSRERAETDSRRARQAVEKMTEAGRELYRQKGRAEAGRKMLEQVVVFHEGFVAEKSDDPTVIQEAAEAWATVGLIRDELGQPGAAVEGMRRSVALMDRLIELQPTVAAHQATRAARSRLLGHYLRGNNQSADARGAYIEAEAAARKLLGGDPNNVSFLMLLSNSLLNNALTFRATQPAQAEAMFNEALALHARGLAASPGNRAILIDQAIAKQELGMFLWDRERSPRGEGLVREAVAILDRLGGAKSTGEDVRWFHARGRLYLGSKLYHNDRVAEAEVEFQGALDEFKRLREDNSRNPRYLEYSFELCHAMAVVRRKANDYPEAEAAYREANAAARLLRAEFPDRVDSFRGAIVACLADHAGLLLLMRRPAQAAEIASQMTEWDPKSKLRPKDKSPP